MTESVTDIHKGGVPVERRQHIIVTCVVLLLAIGVATWWVLREPAAPTLLGDRTAVGFAANPRPVSEAAGFAGIAFPSDGEDEVVTFKGVPKVHFRTNTAAATARVGVCVQAPGEGTFGTGRASDLGTACREVSYVMDGTQLRWISSGDDPQEYLILVVTPTRPGVATVDRITYNYERESGESGLDTGVLHYTIRAT